MITPDRTSIRSELPKWWESIENAIQCHSAAAYVSESVERIPRRPPPEFNESDEGMISAIANDGFLEVALNDTNQYGPHAMVMLLFAVSAVTALALFLTANISPLFALLAVVVVLFLGWWWFRWQLRRALMRKAMREAVEMGL